MNLENIKLQTLKDRFCENFTVNQLCLDLMDELENSKLRKFIIEQFNKEFSKKEIEEIFEGSEEETEEEYDYIDYEAWILSEEASVNDYLEEHKAIFPDVGNALEFLNNYPIEKVPSNAYLVIEKVGHNVDMSTCIDVIREKHHE